MKKMTRLFLFTAMLASVGMAPMGYAADATAFNPLAVSVEAQAISGVPVGTIIAWPVASNPEGWDEGNWLECNGQSISPTVYPELVARIGGRVPDLRGLFLRGAGGNAATLGQVQGTAGMPIAGSSGLPPCFRMDFGAPWGAFSWGSSVGVRVKLESGTGTSINLNLSNSYPTANEFRPVNVSVRYLIRAH